MLFSWINEKTWFLKSVTVPGGNCFAFGIESSWLALDFREKEELFTLSKRVISRR